MMFGRILSIASSFDVIQKLREQVISISREDNERGLERSYAHNVPSVGVIFHFVKLEANRRGLVNGPRMTNFTS